MSAISQQTNCKDAARQKPVILRMEQRLKNTLLHGSLLSVRRGSTKALYLLINDKTRPAFYLEIYLAHIFADDPHAEDLKAAEPQQRQHN